MKLDFKEFFALCEMGDVTTADTSDIKLEPDDYGDGYKYVFTVDGEKYQVSFGKTTVYLGSGGTRADKAFNISLKGPQGYAPTGRGRGTTIYRHLIKAVKKVIETVNPEAFSFTGAYPEQDIMYAQFYEKYMKGTYTKINDDSYVRNDYIESLKDSDPTSYQYVQRSIQRQAGDRSIDNMRQEKLLQRQKRVQMRQAYANLIGRIAYDADYDRVVYVQNIDERGKAEVLDSRGASYRTTATNIRKLDQLRDYQHSEVDELEELLRTRGIQVQGHHGQRPQRQQQQIDPQIAQLKNMILYNKVSLSPVYIKDVVDNTTLVGVNSEGWPRRMRLSDLEPLARIMDDDDMTELETLEALLQRQGIHPTYSSGSRPTAQNQSQDQQDNLRWS